MSSVEAKDRTHITLDLLMLRRSGFFTSPGSSNSYVPVDLAIKCILRDNRFGVSFPASAESLSLPTTIDVVSVGNASQEGPGVNLKYQCFYRPENTQDLLIVTLSQLLELSQMHGPSLYTGGPFRADVWESGRISIKYGSLVFRHDDGLFGKYELASSTWRPEIFYDMSYLSAIGTWPRNFGGLWG